MQKAIALMGIDTVALVSPTLPDELADRLERMSIMKQGIDMTSGEELWNITTGELDGSYDSRISFRVMRERFVCDSKGTPQLQPCDPYLKIEASWPKVFHGTNVFGTIEHFQYNAERFIDTVAQLFSLEEDELPYAKHWEVHRVDWAEMFDIPYSGVTDFFRCLSAVRFPRRKVVKYGFHAIHAPGSTTTLRLYHKGPEFKEHDYSKIKSAFLSYFREKFDAQPIEDIYAIVNKKVKALQRLADRRLRCEIQINARKLQDDFAEQLLAEGQGRKYPKVSEITDEYLINIYTTEMQKLLKEGKTTMDTVRNNDAVQDRLISVYGKRSSRSLLAFWLNLSAMGEERTKLVCSESQYYANRKKLMDAGVSWLNTNIYILPPQSLLPVDFQPLRTSARICQFPIRHNSLLNLCPTEYQEAVNRAA